MGRRCGTFGDLYRELLERAGHPAPLASPPIVHRLVQATVDQVHAAGELNYYAGLKDTPGFALALREVFAELKRALVFPETLIERTSFRQPCTAGVGSAVPGLSEPTAHSWAGPIQKG